MSFLNNFHKLELDRAENRVIVTMFRYIKHFASHTSPRQPVAYGPLPYKFHLFPTNQVSRSLPC